MLWKRSRTLTNSSNKQVLMAENTSLSSPTSKHLRPISSFFSSPKFFATVFSPKGGNHSSDQTTESSTLSPTSILDTKPFSTFVNPFAKPSYENKNQHPWEKKLDSGGIGLGIVDVLNEELDPPSKPDTSRMVLFGSQLKIQIPVLQSNSVLSPSESPKSPTDFGTKTKKDCQFGSANSGLDQVNGSSPGRVFIGCLSASEMELSEDYTCVIAHGPNPKTTHIFDDCIVENCCGSIVGFSSSFKKQNGFSTSVNSPTYSSSAQNFLSYCYNCKKNLGQGNDIFMYRGEKAFCSHECRYQEMVLDEGTDNQCS